jgi:streptogramin lyase
VKNLRTTPVISETATAAGAGPLGITTGPDGALWFTNTFNCHFCPPDSIGRITTGGVVTNYLGAGINGPGGIIAGPDGALWFTNGGNALPSRSIGRITTGGVVTNYTGTDIFMPGGITAGPDGALWFTNGTIGRITTGGAITEYTGTGISATGGGITAGPDGALWFTDQVRNLIGRITVLAITTSSLPNAAIGARYSQTLSAIGGVPPYTWKLVRGSGKLPRGLRLDKSMGVISGTPAKRSTTSTFTVEVLDTKARTRPHRRDTATATFTITISQT